MHYFHSKSMILFDVTSVEFAYVATAESGTTETFYDFKIGFYRLTFGDIAHVFDLHNQLDIERVVGFSVISICVLGCLFGIVKKMIQTMEKRNAAKKPKGSLKQFFY